VELFNWTMHAEALSRLQTGTDLRGALRGGELELHYQPVISLTTGRVCAGEALMRWRHPRRGLLSSAEFVGVAEETGLIVPLGRWALGEACRQARAWNDARARTRPADPPLGVAVNLSTRQFSQADLAAQVQRALRREGLAPALLTLEITEGAVVGQPDLAPHTLAALRSLGVRVSMDDFGTGYSSLNYLHRLPLDAVKIDRAFVSEMEAEGRSLELVRTVLRTVQQLGLETVAEGVDSAAQLAALRSLGCTHAQGHYFAQPLSADAFAALVAEGPTW
jgi:EAL domain-containing protein (putative c-di-GMP-specific phosphodiesterase class I)